ncbi:MAG TPA: hypothetical protein VJ233_06160 [Hyphomicrobiaceae bacterium]|nr:hypothetical protein [Hyphomicrobiaceae bacterium]
MSQRHKNRPSQRPGRPKRGAQAPGKHAHKHQRLIGYGILLLAVLLIVIGSALT